MRDFSSLLVFCSLAQRATWEYIKGQIPTGSPVVYSLAGIGVERVANGSEGSVDTGGQTIHAGSRREGD